MSSTVNMVIRNNKEKLFLRKDVEDDFNRRKRMVSRTREKKKNF